MYSLLAEIDRYIKEKGIPFESVVFNYSYLPKYINQAILCNLRLVEGTNRPGIELGPKEYELKYDENGVLCLVIRSNDNRTKIVIANSSDKVNLGYPVTKFSEESIIRKACQLKQMDGFIQECYKKIKDNMQGSTPVERIKLGNDIINTVLANNMVNFNEDMIDDIELSESVKQITYYIDYLNKIYLEEMQYKSENKMHGIRFSEPESDRIIRRNPGIISENPKERINSVIPADDRIRVLDCFRPIFKEYAYSENNEKIDYMNYLYRLSPNKLVLIMEPYSGMKYTKIAIINFDGVMSYEEFTSEVKKYLELNYSELSKLGNVVKCSHTSLQSFKKMLQFTLNNNDEEYTNIFFKEKVRNLKGQ